MTKLKVALLAVLACLAAQTRAPAATVMSTFDEKLRYERSLEQKADELLLKVLGPNQARVSVEATLKIEEALPPAKGADGRFAWLDAAQKTENARELLPGYRAPVAPGPMSDSEARAFSFKVSKLAATIIAAGDMTPQKGAEVSDLVSRVVGIDPARGDTLDLVRTSFAAPWKTVWYSPEYLGFFVRYGIIAAVIIISFLIIGVGIMRLASAMGSVARSQDHEVSIGFSGAGGAGPEGQGLPGGGGPPGLPAPSGEKKGGEAAAPEDGRVVFSVRPDQVPVLLSMIGKEDPENIALVVYHLPEEVRGRVLSGLGRELASQVVKNLATVRFVEKDMIAEIKSELERRLDSAVGGIEKAIEIMAPMRYGERRELVRQFDASDPALAAEIRRAIIFDDDLLRLDEKGMGQLVMSMPVAQWADVFPSLLPELQAKLKAQLPPNSAKMLEDSLKYADKTPERLDAELDKFMAKVTGLIKEGKLPRPAPAAPRLAAPSEAKG